MSLLLQSAVVLAALAQLVITILFAVFKGGRWTRAVEDRDLAPVISPGSKVGNNGPTLGELHRQLIELRETIHQMQSQYVSLGEANARFQEFHAGRQSLWEAIHDLRTTGQAHQRRIDVLMQKLEP